MGWRPVDSEGKAGPFEFITYKEVQTQAKTVASGLVTIGFKPKAKLGVFAANCVEWMVSIKAADTIGATIVPIYDSLGATAVEYICNHSELSVAVVETHKLSAIAAVADKVNTVKAVVYLGVGDSASADQLTAAGIKVYSWAQIMEIGKQNAVAPVPPKPEDLACIMYTSGTTGTPKGVELTHKNLVAAVTGASMMGPQSGVNFNSNDSVLSFLTLAHSYGKSSYI